MNNELTKAGASYLAKSSDQSLKRDMGKTLVGASAGALALSGLAAALPFVTLPMLIVLGVVLGGYWWMKG